MSANDSVSNAELLAYVDELLPIERAAEVEESLRSSENLRQRAAELLRDRDEGTHTLADIWRRHRVSCPSRRELGEYLLGTLAEPAAVAVEIHLEDVACRFCQADRDDMVTARGDADSSNRRKRVFESTVGVPRR